MLNNSYLSYSQDFFAVITIIYSTTAKVGLLHATSQQNDRLIGLVVKASALRVEDPGFKSCLCRDFSGLSHTSDLKIGTPVATLPGAWRYRVSAGTGWPGVSILWLGEMKIWSATSISVWQHVQLPEQIHPWDTLTCCWDVKQPTNNITTEWLHKF